MSGNAPTGQVLLRELWLTKADLPQLSHVKSNDKADVPNSFCPGNASLLLELGKVLLGASAGLGVPAQPSSADSLHEAPPDKAIDGGLLAEQFAG
jgi:hypothetical protein